jgi:hypothetical protein
MDARAHDSFQSTVPPSPMMARMSTDAGDERRIDGTRRVSSAASAIARRPGVWITLAALVAAGALGLLQARGPLVTTAAVTRGDIEQHLVASGRVRVVTRVQLTAQTAGRITQVAVREGQRVRPGFDLMRRFNRQYGTTFLVVTHDPRIAARCERVIEIIDGRITSDRASRPDPPG